jgi:phenylalanyl-tRNA synthetase alpha chain
MDLFAQIEVMQAQIEAETATTPAEVEAYRIKYIGTKGEVKALMEEMRNVPGDQKRAFGQAMNALKTLAEEKWQQLKDATEGQEESIVKPDLTAPAYPVYEGGRHPVALTLERINGIFNRLGFSIVDGPEVEDDWHNFGAMNMPEDHSARDMQDTFYVVNAPNMLLRTHTSNVQARVMEHRKPPIRVIAPGRVYRNETISARSHAQFHQVEGLYVDENVSYADMQQTLLYFAKEMYGAETKIRMRPSYFPFTEPSVEVDVSCFICNATGCNVCKQSGWVEILGCGMVDPQVLENCGIDSEKYTGFAFGMGIERQTMMLYGIKDIRLLFENDIRFLAQFSS